MIYVPKHQSFLHSSCLKPERKRYHSRRQGRVGGWVEGDDNTQRKSACLRDMRLSLFLLVGKDELCGTNTFFRHTPGLSGSKATFAHIILEFRGRARNNVVVG